jgi:hypothetical protein
MSRDVLVSFILVCGTGLARGDIIARQDFDVLPAGSLINAGVGTGEALPHGAASHDGSQGIGFRTTWVQVWPELPVGPVAGGADVDDYVGVNTFAGDHAPDVGPSGVSVAAGIEQTFALNDADGALVLEFDPVSTAGFAERWLRFDYWLPRTGYEAGDSFHVSIGTVIGPITLIPGGVDVMNGVSSNDDGTMNWQSYSIRLESLPEQFGQTFALKVILSTDADNESLFIDRVRFEGTPIPAPASLALVLLAACRRRRRERRG